MINEVAAGDVLRGVVTGGLYVIKKAEPFGGEYSVSYERYDGGVIVGAGEFYGLTGWHVELVGRNYQKKAAS